MAKEILSIEVGELDLDFKQYGFHFTNLSLEDNTISRDGIIPRIGDNSKGHLGRESIQKSFFSKGVEGLLQTYNRLINIAFEMPVAGLRGISHEKYLPESAKAKIGTEELLSTEEAFVFLKGYLKDLTYLVFEAPKTEYENEISSEQLENINKDIKESDSYSAIQKLDDLKDKKATAMARNEISRKIRQETISKIDAIRGNKVKDGVYDVVDYNEDRLKWLIQTPNNVHTKIVTDENGTHGVPILPETIKRVVYNGKDDSVSVVAGLMEKRDKTKPYGLKLPYQYDIEMIEALIDYTELPEDLTKEEKKKFFDNIDQYRRVTKELFKAEREGAPIPEFSEEENEYLGENGKNKIHGIAEQIIGERIQSEGRFSIENITTFAIHQLDAKQFRTMEAFMRDVDDEKNHILKPKEDKSYSKDE